VDAAQLSISVRTVRSRLDRIRVKTGSRRRADLTRLALQADLVLSGPHWPGQRIQPSPIRTSPAMIKVTPISCHRPSRSPNMTSPASSGIAG